MTTHKTLPKFAICRGCPALCDDLTPTLPTLNSINEIAGGQKIAASAGETEMFTAYDSFSEPLPVPFFQVHVADCSKGQAWFDRLPLAASYRVRGEHVSKQAAIEAAASLLMRAKLPLIVQLDGLSTAAQQQAWRLTDLIRGSIDTTLIDSNRASLAALQQVGKVTATFGEIRQRSELIIFWFCDPLTSHPRLWDRFQSSSLDRTVKTLVFDQSESLTAQRSDQFIRLNADAKPKALAVLRGLMAGLTLDAEDVLEQTGHPLSIWQEVTQRCLNIRYGSWISGPAGNDADGIGNSLAQAHWIRELNQKTRFVNLTLRDDGNTSSAENMLAWSSGFAAAITCRRGYPQSQGNEYSAQKMLESRECDLILIGSTAYLSDQLKRLPASSLDFFNSVPKIVLRETDDWADRIPNVLVELGVAQAGRTVAGGFNRIDDVPLMVPPQWPRELSGEPAEEIFAHLFEQAIAAR